MVTVSGSDIAGNNTITEKDLKKLKKELQELKDELLLHIDEVS